MQKPNDNYKPVIQEVINGIDQKHVEHIKRQRNIIDELKASNPLPYKVAVLIAVLTIIHLITSIIDTVKGWL